MQIEGPRDRFLARPFWRDYVVACVLTGVGFMLIDIGAPYRDRTERLLVLAPAISLFGCGLLVFCCAVGWSLRAACRSWKGRRGRV